MMNIGNNHTYTLIENIFDSNSREIQNHDFNFMYSWFVADDFFKLK